jgi:hypothetical protein
MLYLALLISKEASHMDLSLKLVKSDNKRIDTNHFKTNAARPSTSSKINQTTIICTKAKDELFNMLTNNVHGIQYSKMPYFFQNPTCCNPTFLALFLLLFSFGNHFLQFILFDPSYLHVVAEFSK